MRVYKCLSATYILLVSFLSDFAVNIISSSEFGNHEIRTNANQSDVVVSDSSTSPDGTEAKCDIKFYKLNGNIFTLQHDDLATKRISLMSTKILINYGQYVAYPKDDGSFEVDDLPSDSYVIEVTHPKFIYEPIRVDITSKGKIRARRVNYIQPSLVQTVNYPLQFKPIGLHNYFLARETWTIGSIIFNPMILMMFIPLVLAWVLPKLVSKEDEQREPMPMPEVPELSEMVASMFGKQDQKALSNQASNPGVSSQASSGASNSKHGKGKRR